VTLLRTRAAKKQLILSSTYAKKHGSAPSKTRNQSLVDLNQKVTRAFGLRAPKALLYPLTHQWWNNFGELDRAKFREGKVRLLSDFESRTGDSNCKYKWKDPQLAATYNRLELTRKWATPEDTVYTRKWYHFRGDTYLVGNTKSAFLFLRAARRAGRFIDELIELAERGYKPLAWSSISPIARSLRPDNACSKWFVNLAYKLRSLKKLLKVTIISCAG